MFNFFSSGSNEELKTGVRVAGFGERSVEHLEKLDKDLLEGPTMASEKVSKLEKWIDDMEFMLLMLKRHKCNMRYATTNDYKTPKGAILVYRN